jgi:hypothetical protein
MSEFIVCCKCYLSTPRGIFKVTRWSERTYETETIGYLCDPCAWALCGPAITVTEDADRRVEIAEAKEAIRKAKREITELQRQVMEAERIISAS